MLGMAKGKISVLVQVVTQFSSSTTMLCVWGVFMNYHNRINLWSVISFFFPRTCSKTVNAVESAFGSNKLSYMVTKSVELKTGNNKNEGLLC